MASNINITNIDTAYPIAGQDNDSQGFRDNFTNIVSGLSNAKQEIEELQNNVLLKGPLPLGGIAIDNNLGNALIHSAQYRNINAVVSNLGALSADAAINISAASAPHYKAILSGANTVAFTGFPAAGEAGTVRLEVEVTSVADTLILPATVSVGDASLYGMNPNSREITFPTTGVYIYDFVTTTQGQEIAVSEVVRPASAMRVVPAPLTAIGRAGDQPGMVAYDSSFYYVCVGAFDNATPIWRRTSIAAW